MPKEYLIKFGKNVRTRKIKYKRGKNEAKKALTEGKKDHLTSPIFSYILQRRKAYL